MGPLLTAPLSPSLQHPTGLATMHRHHPSMPILPDWMPVNRLAPRYRAAPSFGGPSQTFGNLNAPRLPYVRGDPIQGFSSWYDTDFAGSYAALYSGDREQTTVFPFRDQVVVCTGPLSNFGTSCVVVDQKRLARMPPVFLTPPTAGA